MPNYCASIKRVLMFSKPGIISRWDDDYCEYMLVAPLAMPARESVGKKKIILFKQDGESVSDTFSYISLTRFMARQRMEEIFSRWIRNICSMHCGFTISLNHSNSKPPGNFYLAKSDEAPFKKLADSLRVLDSYMESNSCPPLKFERPPVYHGSFSFTKNENDPIDNENRHFQDRFTIEKLQLLRSDVMMNFNIVNNFAFLSPLPIPE